MDDFWGNVIKTDGCWTLRGTRPGRYGRLRWLGKRVYAHRLAYELTYEDPKELDVLHRCDNPSCCRPDHLFIGTHQDNMRDRHEKRRDARGTRNGNSRYSDETVTAIRAAVAAGGTFKGVARTFGCSDFYVMSLFRDRIRKRDAGEVVK